MARTTEEEEKHSHPLSLSRWALFMMKEIINRDRLLKEDRLEVGHIVCSRLPYSALMYCVYRFRVYSVFIHFNGKYLRDRSVTALATPSTSVRHGGLLYEDPNESNSELNQTVDPLAE